MKLYANSVAVAGDVRARQSRSANSVDQICGRDKKGENKRADVERNADLAASILRSDMILAPQARTVRRTSAYGCAHPSSPIV
eukprot:5056749-Pleurochrysis_carterae.AAC.5